MQKSTAWLKRAAADSSVDAHRLLGLVLEELMDTDIHRNFINPEYHEKAKGRVADALGRAGLEYMRGGRVIATGISLPVRQLDDVLRNRDLGGVNAEFDRALVSVSSDPGSAATAACAILESLCRVYIEDEKLEMPTDRSIQPLWRVVQADLGLDPKSVDESDLRQVLRGLSSITHGLGSFRTHVGSAHGRGRAGYQLRSRHARLVVNASHTLAMFILETWDARKVSPAR